MIVGFILNGEDVSTETEAASRLVDVLRTNFNLLGTKSGCCIGNCGVCSVNFNGEVIKACLVPAFKIQGSEIVTIEGFSLTDEYADIVSAFNDSGVESCGFCNTGKILAAEALIGKNAHPSYTEALAAFHGNRCRCTDPAQLAQACLVAVEYRRRRLYGRSR